jgi:hypothetical protein
MQELEKHESRPARRGLEDVRSQAGAWERENQGTLTPALSQRERGRLTATSFWESQSPPETLDWSALCFICPAGIHPCHFCRPSDDEPHSWAERRNFEGA